MRRCSIIGCWVLLAGLCLGLLPDALGEGDTPSAATTTEQAEAQAPVVVGYLPANRLERHAFDAESLGPVTDLVYFSLQVTEDGTIPLSAVNAEHAKQFATLKEAAGCRLLVCVGGWGRSEHFPAAAGDPVKRQRLVESLLAICERYGFDGVDYDWEHPKDQDELDDYAALIEATAELFQPKDLVVTVAQAGWQDLGVRAYQALDRVHLMCYDQPFPQATMQHAKAEVSRLIKWGCPPEKITLGLPFYGRNKDRQAKTYANLLRGLDDGKWDASRDRIAGYAFNGPDTIQAKTEFAMQSGLAGVMVWELSQDEPGPRSLLSAIERGLAASTEPQTAEDQATDAD